MNTTYRSVAPMDMALRRRFAFHRIEPNKPKQENFPITEKYFLNLLKYWSILESSIETLYHLNGIKENGSPIDSSKSSLSKEGADALLGYSYIYDLASDLERYHDKPSKHSQIVQHHWNHHILPQLADILFSNQITGDERKNLLDLIEVNVGGATYGINTPNSEHTLERSVLKLIKT